MNLNTVSATPAQDALLRVWIWLSFHPKVRLFLFVAVACFLCQIVTATVAMAADPDSTPLNTYLLPLGAVTDTHGVPVGRYTELPLDYGQGAYVGRMIRGVLMRLAWMGYTVVVYAILSLCNFVLSLEWVDWVLSPFILLANTIQDLLGRFGIVGLGIFIAALVIAWGLARGKMGAAILEIAIVGLFVGLVSSPIANPSDQIKSWINTSATYGTEAGQAAVAQTEDGAQADVNPVSGQIVDIAIRNPALMLSFGSMLDGSECSKVWDDQAKSGSDTEGLRKKVLSCDEGLKPANETDSFNVFAFMAMFSISTGGLMSLIVVFLVFLLKDVFLAGLGLVNTVFRVHLAVFPGGGRQAFVNAFLQLLVNVIMVGVYIFLLSLYLWLVGILHASLGATVLMIANLIFGLVLLGLALTFWQLKRQGKSVAKKLASVLGGSPLNAAPVRKPSGFSQGASGFAQKGAKVAGRHLKHRFARQVMTKGIQAAAVGTTAGAGLAAARIATAGWANAKNGPRNRTAAANTEAGAAPTTQSYRASTAQELPAGAGSKKALAGGIAQSQAVPAVAAGAAESTGTARDDNGAIPMGKHSMAALPQAETQPGQAETLRTPEALNAPSGDLLPGSQTSTNAGTGELENNANATASQASTGTTPPATGGQGPQRTPQPRSTLPAGKYGNVRVNRDGSTNNILSGNVVESLPVGLKSARTWEVPVNGSAQSRNRRQATVQTAAYQMNSRSRNHSAERGDTA